MNRRSFGGGRRFSFLRPDNLVSHMQHEIVLATSIGPLSRA